MIYHSSKASDGHKTENEKIIANIQYILMNYVDLANIRLMQLIKLTGIFLAHRSTTSESISTKRNSIMVFIPFLGLSTDAEDDEITPSEQNHFGICEQNERKQVAFMKFIRIFARIIIAVRTKALATHHSNRKV